MKGGIAKEYFNQKKSVFYSTCSKYKIYEKTGIPFFKLGCYQGEEMSIEEGLYFGKKLNFKRV